MDEVSEVVIGGRVIRAQEDYYRQFKVHLSHRVSTYFVKTNQIRQAQRAICAV